MSERTPGESTGLMDSLTAVGATLVGMAHTRLDLLSTDLEEAREHFLSLTILGFVALFSVGVGVVLSALFLVVAFWETHRLLMLGALAGFFLAAGVAALVFAKQRAKTTPRLFASSLSELFKDRQQLVPRP